MALWKFLSSAILFMCVHWSNMELWFSHLLRRRLFGLLNLYKNHLSTVCIRSLTWSTLAISPQFKNMVLNPWNIEG
uniref:Secreted protein n=1 Tax=Caenorhabditis japonica TaxID=281687 RepID=A0A8R1E8A0_CAEJA